MFESSFAVQHCQSAREKCGYCLATQSALFHKKCQRVMGDNIEESINALCPMNNDELIDYLNFDYDTIL